MIPKYLFLTFLCWLMCVYVILWVEWHYLWRAWKKYWKLWPIWLNWPVQKSCVSLPDHVNNCLDPVCIQARTIFHYSMGHMYNSSLWQNQIIHLPYFCHPICNPYHHKRVWVRKWAVQYSEPYVWKSQGLYRNDDIVWCVRIWVAGTGCTRMLQQKIDFHKPFFTQMQLSQNYWL